MRTRLLPLYLLKDEYDTLDRIAREQERDVLQEARWIIREAIRDRGGQAVQQALTTPVPARTHAAH